ncbi:DUF447 domain-containing protein [Halovivax cerinus]|uniref:DUF447 domain-containing protein n=1 Tax=Halovivax cerinus TaxID=1487865 RepID=A0ABD5NNK0_9EURY|nr:DUF447 domain-containing protein [Halovivax cerinus]
MTGSNESNRRVESVASDGEDPSTAGGAKPSDCGADETAPERVDDGGVDWPVELTGVTESLVTTLGPNDRWNVAPLGLFAGDPVTATTWGATRTRRNVDRTGEGYVQFVTDPVTFVDAALSIVETTNPVVDQAHAWAHVEFTRVDSGHDGDTEWVRWALVPVETTIVSRTVPTLSRGLGAVIEASVAASRLGTDAYDESTCRRTIARAGDVVERAGSPREREAFDRLLAHVDEDITLE